MDKDQDIALELVKNWLEENDANILLMNKEVVRWTSLDGSIENMGWRHDSLASIATLIKGTVMPLPMMKYVDTNFIISAGQETGRVYEAGVTVNGTCLANYFNYNAKRQLSTLERVIKSTLVSALGTAENIDAKSIYAMIDSVIDKLNLEPISAQRRNSIINSFKAELNFNHRHGNNRLSIRKANDEIIKYTAIQQRKLLTEPITPTSAQFEMWVSIAVSEALN